MEQHSSNAWKNPRPLEFYSKWINTKAFLLPRALLFIGSDVFGFTLDCDEHETRLPRGVPYKWKSLFSIISYVVVGNVVLLGVVAGIAMSRSIIYPEIYESIYATTGYVSLTLNSMMTLICFLVYKKNLVGVIRGMKDWVDRYEEEVRRVAENDNENDEKTKQTFNATVEKYSRNLHKASLTVFVFMFYMLIQSYTVLYFYMRDISADRWIYDIALNCYIPVDTTKVFCFLMINYYTLFRSLEYFLKGFYLYIAYFLYLALSDTQRVCLKRNISRKIKDFQKVNDRGSVGFCHSSCHMINYTHMCTILRHTADFYSPILLCWYATHIFIIPVWSRGIFVSITQLVAYSVDSALTFVYYWIILGSITIAGYAVNTQVNRMKPTVISPNEDENHYTDMMQRIRMVHYIDTKPPGFCIHGLTHVNGYLMFAVFGVILSYILVLHGVG